MSEGPKCKGCDEQFTIAQAASFIQGFCRDCTEQRLSTLMHENKKLKQDTPESIDCDTAAELIASRFCRTDDEEAQRWISGPYANLHRVSKGVRLEVWTREELKAEIVRVLENTQ